MCDQRVQKKKTKTLKRKHKRVLCLLSETAQKFDFFYSEAYSCSETAQKYDFYSNACSGNRFAIEATKTDFKHLENDKEKRRGSCTQE